jgi:hypothetical protein
MAKSTDWMPSSRFGITALDSGSNYGYAVYVGLIPPATGTACGTIALSAAKRSLLPLKLFWHDGLRLLPLQKPERVGGLWCRLLFYKK